MPATLDKREGQPLDPQIISRDYNYDYPEGLDLKPDSEKHKALLAKINERARKAKNAISSRYADWRRVDNSLRLYATADWKTGFGVASHKKSTKSASADESRSDAPLFVMPVSKATHETLMTYMTSAFITAPMFRYEGTGPEDVYGAILMEQVVQQMVERNAVALNVHTLIGDSFTYGFGVAHPLWKVIYGPKAVEKKKSGALADIARIFGRDLGTERTIETGIIYEGVAVDNIDPYRFYPDPSVPIHRLDDAEYLSWLTEHTYGNLLSRDKDEDDILFNVRYLENAEGKSSLGWENAEQRKPVTVHGPSSQIDVLWMYIDLIPKEWGLGRGTYPESWLFAVAGDKLIIAAQKLDFLHGKKPAVVAAPDYDGHNLYPSSRIESINSLQHFIDFLYTSRIANMRKSLNDMFVADPSLVNIHDLMNPAPGKVIRLRKANWGRGTIDQAIKQLSVLDVTQNNVSEMAFIEQLAHQFAGVPENLQGAITNRGPRISASQANGARSSSFSRLERLATIIDIQAMRPMGRMFASYVQQFMSEDTYVKMTGETLRRYEAAYGIPSPVTGERVKVSPLDLMVNYDLRSSTNIVPGSQDPQTWIQLLQLAGSMANPQILNSLDFSKIFLHIARQLGATNVEDFILRAPPVVMPDEQVSQQEAAGNIIPIENAAA